MLAQSDLEIASRTSDTFEFHQEIHQNMGELDDILSWCRSECLGEWRWRMLEPSNAHSPGHYCFYFDDGRDACAFVLRWR